MQGRDTEKRRVQEITFDLSLQITLNRHSRKVFETMFEESPM